MQRLGSDGWSMRIDHEQHCSNMLYVRDTAGLTGPADYNVPPLGPAVELRAELAPYATAGAAEDWERWWSEHLEQLGRITKVDVLPVGPPPEPGTDLRALFNAVIDEANAWHREREIEYVERTTGLAGRRLRGQGGDTVARIERELGRKSAPFELTVKLLPLDRKWARRVNPTLVVVSDRLWLDPDARDTFLDPVVRALA